MSFTHSNLFLSRLSPESRDAIVSRATVVNLPLQTVLYRPGVAPRYVCFLMSGLASVATPTLNRRNVEIAFVGREGMVGSMQLLGPTVLGARCTINLAGHGLRIPFAALKALFDSSEEIRNRILEFVQVQCAILAQVAGCNRLHGTEHRLVRWLLSAQDQTHSGVLNFTQEYLSEMMGTHRTTVTLLAGSLQERGLIDYCRGKIQILDRTRLEAMACECYPVARRLRANLYTSTYAL